MAPLIGICWYLLATRVVWSTTNQDSNQQHTQDENNPRIGIVEPLAYGQFKFLQHDPTPFIN
jgi:hypothetical protein